jgi:glycosyltransferase involved in cell wall biosynthesis
LVSCIVPVHNGARFLGEALDSILAQTYRPLELIVVDDGSTDSTSDVIARYVAATRTATGAGQVHGIRQERSGAPAARNRGLAEAHGAYVAFLDADDRWHPDKLARQVGRFAARPELELCLTHAQNFWDADVNDEESRFQNHPRAEALPGYSTVTLLARRSFFQTVGGFKVELESGDNIDWFLRVAERGAVVEMLPEVLVYRRLHRANLTRRQVALARDECLDLVKAHLDRRRAGRSGAPIDYFQP